MKRILCLIFAVLLALGTVSCGKKDTFEDEDYPCPLCNSYHFGECISCTICGDRHNTTSHPRCRNCNSLYHLEDECTFVCCEICRSEEHITDDHPMCKVEHCNRVQDHITEEHPICTKCNKQHYPFCDGGIPKTYCEICGKDEHNTNDHHGRVCKYCGKDHREPDSRCPDRYCEYCESVTEGHTTKGHPKCKGCGQPITKGHDEEKCLENKKAAESQQPAQKKPEPQKQPDPQKQSEKTEDLPKPEPKAEYYCNNCGKNTSHNTTNCPKLGDTLCASCGHPIHTGTKCNECNCGKAKDLCTICAGDQTDHSNTMHCNNNDCTKFGAYHTDACVPKDTCTACPGNQTNHTANDHCNNNECENVGQYHAGECSIKETVKVIDTCSLCPEVQTDHTANDHCDKSDCSMYGQYHNGQNHVTKDMCSKCDGTQTNHKDDDHCTNPNCTQYSYYHSGDCNVSSVDTCPKCDGVQNDHGVANHCTNQNCQNKGDYHTAPCDTCTKCSGESDGHSISDPHCIYESCEYGVGTYHYPHKCKQCGSERCEHLQ